MICPEILRGRRRLTVINLSGRVLPHRGQRDLSAMKGSRQLWLALGDWSCAFERDAFNCLLFSLVSPVISASDDILDEFSRFVCLELKEEHARPLIYVWASTLPRCLQFTTRCHQTATTCNICRTAATVAEDWALSTLTLRQTGLLLRDHMCCVFQF